MQQLDCVERKKHQYAVLLKDKIVAIDPIAHIYWDSRYPSNTVHWLSLHAWWRATPILSQRQTQWQKGNRMSGVALAMRHRLQWFIHLRTQWLTTGNSSMKVTYCRNAMLPSYVLS